MERARHAQLRSSSIFPTTLIFFGSLSALILRIARPARNICHFPYSLCWSKSRAALAGWISVGTAGTTAVAVKVLGESTAGDVGLESGGEHIETEADDWCPARP